MSKMDNNESSDSRHSIDNEPKHGSNGARIVIIIFIAIIFIVGIIVLVLGFRYKDAAEECENTESLTCYTQTCPAKQLQSCNNPNDPSFQGDAYAFRCVSKTQVQCGWNPGVNVDLIEGELSACSDFVAPDS